MAYESLISLAACIYTTPFVIFFPGLFRVLQLFLSLKEIGPNARMSQSHDKELQVGVGLVTTEY